MSEVLQNDFGLSPELFENIRKYHRALTTKNANQEAFSALAVDKSNLKKVAKDINIEDIKSGKVKPGARVVKFVKLLELANKGAGKWEFAGMEDTGHKGNAFCDLGHPLRYIWYAQNEGVVLSLGVTCFSDFFLVNDEIEAELDKALNMIKGDMTILEEMKKGNVVSKKAILDQFLTPLVLTMFKNGNKNFFIGSYAKFISLGLEPLKSMVVGSVKEILTTLNLIKGISGYNIAADETPFLQMYSYLIYREIAETLSEYGIRMTKTELPYNMGKFTVAETLKDTNVLSNKYKLKIEMSTYTTLVNAMKNSGDTFKFLYNLLQQYIHCNNILSKTNNLNNLVIMARVVKAANTYTVIDKINTNVQGTENKPFYSAYRFFSLNTEEINEAKEIINWVQGLIKTQNTLFFKLCNYKIEIATNYNSNLPDFMMNILGKLRMNELIKMCVDMDSSIEKECIDRLNDLKYIPSTQIKTDMYNPKADIFMKPEADKIISKEFIKVISKYTDTMSSNDLEIVKKFKENQGVAKLTYSEYYSLLKYYVLTDMSKNGLQEYLKQQFIEKLKGLDKKEIYKFNLTKGNEIEGLNDSILRYANITELAKIWNILNDMNFETIVTKNANLLYKYIGGCRITATGDYNFKELKAMSFFETLGMLDYENTKICDEFISCIMAAKDEITVELNTKLNAILEHIKNEGVTSGIEYAEDSYAIITNEKGRYPYTRFYTYTKNNNITDAIQELYNMMLRDKENKIKQKVATKPQIEQSVENKTYYFRDLKTDDFVAREVKKVYAILKCVTNEEDKKSLIDNNKQLSFAWSILGTVSKTQKFSTKQQKFIDMLYDALIGEEEKVERKKEEVNTSQVTSGEQFATEENKTYYLRDNSSIVQETKKKMEKLTELASDTDKKAAIIQFDNKVLDIISSIYKYGKFSTKQLRHIMETYKAFIN